MENNLYIIHDGEGFYEEKKSKFIAVAYSVDNEEKALEYIEAARKKYWDAKHNCYAFAIGANNELTRCSDDGEPAGTAGKPILEVLSGTGIHNCLIIVTRYFGGTLLGTGGLIRAYTKAARDALDSAEIANKLPGERYVITIDYNSIGKIQRLVTDFDAVIENTEYSENVKTTVIVPKEMGTAMCARITDLTNGKAIIEFLDDLWIDVSYDLS